MPDEKPEPTEKLPPEPVWAPAASPEPEPPAAPAAPPQAEPVSVPVAPRRPWHSRVGGRAGLALAAATLVIGCCVGGGVVALGAAVVGHHNRTGEHNVPGDDRNDPRFGDDNGYNYNPRRAPGGNRPMRPGNPPVNPGNPPAAVPSPSPTAS